MQRLQTTGFIEVGLRSSEAGLSLPLQVVLEWSTEFPGFSAFQNTFYCFLSQSRMWTFLFCTMQIIFDRLLEHSDRLNHFRMTLGCNIEHVILSNISNIEELYQSNWASTSSISNWVILVVLGNIGQLVSNIPDDFSRMTSGVISIMTLVCNIEKCR